MEAYHSYRQNVEIVLSICVINWLLWLPFDAGYRKNNVLKLIHLVAQCPNIRSTVLFLKHVL